MRLDIPFSAATERNKYPILAILKKHLSESRSVLEIGAGTGQHCLFFARELPHLLWQPTDLPENLETIALRQGEYPAENLLPPFKLEIGQDQIPSGSFDVIFSSNTFHILPLALVQEFFTQATSSLPRSGLLVIYGPFHYHGKPTGEGNAIFDRNLKRMDPNMGIKDIAQIIELASAAQFLLVEDYAMPVDNRMLVFSKL